MQMQQQPPLAEKELKRVGQILGLLGSAHDGEVVAAARAIGRLLEACNLSWPDLSAFVTDAIAITASQQEPRPVDRIREAAEKLVAVPSLLPHERRFVTSVLAAVRVNPDFKLTQKQAQWFGQLCARKLAA